MPKVIIKPPGPIRDVEMELRDLMVFIGPQAGGKSTISKTVSFFKSLKSLLVEYLYEALEARNFDDALRFYAVRIAGKFTDYFGPSDSLGEFSLQYHYGNGVEISVRKKGGYPHPEFNGLFKEKFRFIVGEARAFTERNRAESTGFLSAMEIIAVESDKRAFSNLVESLPNDLFADHRAMLFVPRGEAWCPPCRIGLEQFDRSG